jgi:hypothetical protein
MVWTLGLMRILLATSYKAIPETQYFNPEDEENVFFRNVDIHSQIHSVS